MINVAHNKLKGMRQSAIFLARRYTPPTIKQIADVSPKLPAVLPQNKSIVGDELKWALNFLKARGVAAVTASKE